MKKKAKSGYKYRNFSSVTIGLVTLENHYSGGDGDKEYLTNGSMLGT